jgi:hypothetical protein
MDATAVSFFLKAAENILKHLFTQKKGKEHLP